MILANNLDYQLSFGSVSVTSHSQYIRKSRGVPLLFSAFSIPVFTTGGLAFEGIVVILSPTQNDRSREKGDGSIQNLVWGLEP